MSNDIRDRLKHEVARKPNIVQDENGLYVIVGSMGHGRQIPQDAMMELIHSLDDVVALKMEGDEETLKILNPMSTEIIIKAAVGSAPVSYFSESDHEDIGQKLLEYGVPEELAEVYAPCNHIRTNDDIPDGFYEALPLFFKIYKQQRFGFINTIRAVRNFINVSNYWMEHELDPLDLDYFSLDFEMFMGDVREFEFWRPDLMDFRAKHDGKIAVSTGLYHVPFVRDVLDGKNPIKPSWSTHLDTKRESVPTQDTTKLKQTYQHLENVLGPVNLS